MGPCAITISLWVVFNHVPSYHDFSIHGFGWSSCSLLKWLLRVSYFETHPYMINNSYNINYFIPNWSKSIFQTKNASIPDDGTSPKHQRVPFCSSSWMMSDMPPLAWPKVTYSAAMPPRATFGRGQVVGEEWLDLMGHMNGYIIMVM